MPGRRAFLRRGHVAAAAVRIGHDRRHRGPVGAYPARGAARCRPGLRATRPRTKRFPAVGGGTRRGTAPSRWPRASVPARQRQRTPRRLPSGRSPCPSWRPDDPGATTGTWNARLARLERRAIRCPAAPRRRRGTGQRARDASAELAGQAQGAGQATDTCGCYSGYSEDTTADNVSSPGFRTRRGYSEDTQNGA